METFIALPLQYIWRQMMISLKRVKGQYSIVVDISGRTLQ